MNSFEEFSCPVVKLCGGCPEGLLPYRTQQEKKLNKLALAFPGVLTSFHSLGEAGLRERGDFIISEGKFCLYSRRDPLGKHSLVPITSCPQLTPKLNLLFKELQDFDWPIKKGSIRFRLNPNPQLYPGPQKGVWLDFANLDIKKLLEDAQILKKLLHLGYYIEVGQKQKQVVSIDEKLKLVDGTCNIWSVTFVDRISTPLFSHISSFTQTGEKANFKFAEILEQQLALWNSRNIVEFGSGIGTLSFPALGSNRNLKACEYETNALQALKRSFEFAQKNINLSERLILSVGNFHKLQASTFFDGFDTILLNPPRSGIGNFTDCLKDLEPNKRPRNIFYMSCFLESMQQDMHQLSSFGYRVKSLHLIDQFPQSAHFETIAIIENQ